MAFDKKEMIKKLKMEIDFIEKGGYYPSVRDPRKDPRTFRDSVTCLNMGTEEKVEPCAECFLIQFVPPIYRNDEMPCHHIPLDRSGATVASLETDSDKRTVALLKWLYSTIALLEAQVAEEQEGSSINK